MLRFLSSAVHSQANSYGLLLLMQLVLLLLPAIFYFVDYMAIPELCLSGVILGSIYIVTQTRQGLIVGGFLGLIAVLMIWVDVFTPRGFTDIMSSTVMLAYFTFAGSHLARFIARSPSIDSNLVYAAVAGFIFIGLIGGGLLHIIELTRPGSFNVGANHDMYDFLYFSFVTLTTLGYGEITPQTPVAQSLCVILAITGQIYLTVIIALIIGKFIAKKT